MWRGEWRGERRGEWRVGRRGSLVASMLVASLCSAVLTQAASAADALKEIRIDWATYNPVSMLLKNKGLLEKAFAKDGIAIVWVQTLGSNKALEFLNAGSIDFGSTAGSAALGWVITKAWPHPAGPAARG